MTDIPEIYYYVFFTNAGSRRFASWIASKAPRADMAKEMGNAIDLAGFQWTNEPLMYEVSGLYTRSKQPETFEFAPDDLDIDGHIERQCYCRLTPIPGMERIYRCRFTDGQSGEQRTSLRRYPLGEIVQFKNATPLLDDWVLAPTDDHFNRNFYEYPDQGEQP